MRNKLAFSLVEVVLALGIVSFSFVTIVGLVPVGLKAFQRALETNVQTQITQQVTGEILRSQYLSFSPDLNSDANSNPNFDAFRTSNFPKCFDAQGLPLAGAQGPGTPGDPTNPSCIYTVNLPSTAFSAANPRRATLPGAASMNASLLVFNFEIKKKTDAQGITMFSVLVPNNGL